ncbi:sperm-egg fusion protein TMEM95 isoform X4 [Homo sapiens]|uniref:sperm-egg fusion protein TMEM95 isoform X4 n=1 Tax=Homo sapiens TaxID=9606 RepID=UPI0007DC72A1|nr:sperm-egg fusion protein TMEM95 isoform X4 [Homo sapiens]XP_054171907.1 sperm-egg fusion protein TMEM95 isoform X4 [Homo sapiens]XP_054188632.1 sperm-egg fusion protein TMEM95 isoform X4 [Homo sapiens]|eukprot:XP_016880056.1 transmembrane protein 95 isoform X3 [Homo sapiens]
MWRLALGGVFLAAAQACVFCRLPAHDLSGRLARLCSQMEARQKECGASPDFSAFALDEVSMNKVTEKTHRVLRVMGGSTTLYNCSTCKGTEVSCWPRKRCFPGPTTSKQKVACEDAENLPASSSKGVRWPPGNPGTHSWKVPPLQPSTNHMAVNNARKISTEGKNPLRHSHHTHTPFCLFRESGGICPRSYSRPSYD